MDEWSLYDISQFAPSSPEVRCRHFHTSHHQNLIKRDRNRCDVTDVYAEQTDGKVSSEQNTLVRRAGARHCLVLRLP